VIFSRQHVVASVRVVLGRLRLLTRVCTAADRPARRSGSAHAKYSVWHRTVIKPVFVFGLAVKYRSRRCVWSTVVRWPSEVYDTHRRTKLTAPETISRSRDRPMVCAHQNLNGSRDLTTPLSGIVCYPWQTISDELFPHCRRISRQ